MRDTKQIRGGMRDGIILLGPGYAVLHGREAGWYHPLGIGIGGFSRSGCGMF